MRRCRLLAGPRCILSNHDLDTVTPASILPIFVFERKFGPNLTFQTYHVVPPDFEGTLRKGISLGASSIEVWQEAQLGSFEHQSRRNAGELGIDVRAALIRKRLLKSSCPCGKPIFKHNGLHMRWSRRLHRVKSGKPQYQHMSSVVHPTTDIPANGRFAPTAVVPQMTMEHS